MQVKEIYYILIYKYSFFLESFPISTKFIYSLVWFGQKEQQLQYYILNLYLKLNT